MCPRMATDDSCNLVRAYSKLFRKNWPTSVFVVFSYPINFIFSKFMAVFFTYSLTLFCISIFYIFKLRSNPKMFWINTRTNIALMENFHTFRYFTPMDFPRDTMRSHNFFIPSDYSVTSFSLISSPYPTCRSFFNEIKKPFFYRDNFRFPITGSALFPLSISECFLAFGTCT